MGDLIGRLIDWIKELWPFRIVSQWEQAAYYVFGRYKKTVGPGVYPLVPFFMEIRSVSMVPDLVHTDRQDVTLKDGTLLMFMASARVCCVDVNLSENTVVDAEGQARALLASVLADKLADVDPARLKPEGRRRLLSDLQRWVNEETKTFGIETRDVWFTSFVQNPKAFRLITDGSVFH